MLAALGVVFVAATGLAQDLDGGDPPNPEAPGAAIGEDNPTGVSGIYNGNVTTGCSYDPQTFNAMRVVDDIVVPGSVGAYPLKWTRYNNSRSKAGFKTGGWTFSYDYGLDPIKFPDGRVIDFTSETVINGVEETTGGWNGHPAIVMADGGKVAFEYHSYSGHGVDPAGHPWTIYYTATIPIALVDPYGQVTNITYDNPINDEYGNPTWRRIRITGPGARYLQLNYGSNPANTLVTSVQACDGRGNVMETVSYTWETLTHGIQEFPTIARVDYSDGTFATYTNGLVGGTTIKKAVLKTAQDVRHSGPMRQIGYEHMDGEGGGITLEKKLSGEVVSRIAYGQHASDRIETRGDGSTIKRSFKYGGHGTIPDGTQGKLLWYTDFLNPNHKTNLNYETTETVPSWGFLKSVTDANNHTTTYTRSTQSWAIKKVTFPDTSFIEQTFTDELNPYYLASRTAQRGPGDTAHTTTYTRNDPLNPNAITRKDYPDGSYEIFAYNGFGQVVTHSRTKALSPLGLETETFSYDTRGLKTSHVDPLGNTTTYSYYSPGDAEFPAWCDRLKTVTHPANISGFQQTDTFEYDKVFSSGAETATACAGRGLVTKVKHADGSSITTTHNQWGDVLTVTDELNHSTTNTYDDYGRLLSTTDPLNHTTTNSYLPDGQTNSYVTTSKLPWTTTLPSTKQTKTYYDLNWRKTRVEVAPGTGASNTYFTYDIYGTYTSIGNLVATTDPRGYVTRYHYDVRDRRDQITDALGASLGDANHTTSFTFDYRGNKITETHPNTPQGALLIEYDGYDTMNRLTHKNVHRDATHTDPSSMTYDAAGNLASTTDENGNVYSYTYDLKNRRTSMIYPDTSKHEDTTYDAAGNTKTYTNRNGKIETFLYDNRNRQAGFWWSDNGVTPSQTTVYDAASRATQMVRWFQAKSGSYYCTINFAYYNDNRLQSEEEWTDAFADNVHRTVTYTYDADGNRATVLYPSGTAFNYTYTSRNQPYEIKPGLSGGAAIVSYTYDLSGNIATCALENNTTSAYTVDQLNREMTIVHNLNGGAKRFDYGYNNVSDITLVKRDSGTGDGFTYDRTQQILAFQQNATVDITAGTISGGQTTALEFDGCGNRTKLNGTFMATPNNMNQPTDSGIGHDNNGNTQTYDGWSFIYDAQNRLISATKGATTATFSYDAKNRQIARSINGVVTFSVWDDWELVEEYTTGNVVTAKYLQGAHGPVKSLLNNYYFYQDSLGSTSHIAGANGQLIEYYKYDLYGKLQVWRNDSQVFTPPIVNDLFSGERWISELGLYDLRNRYYSPDLGRFLQPDPIGFKGDASNLYRYCGNDWANHTDPMGLYALGEGFTGQEAERFDKAQQDAANKVENAANRLEHALEKGGKELQSMSQRFDKVFDKGAGTSQNMQKILKVARQMVTALRDKGALGYIAHGRPGWWFNATSHGRDNVLGKGRVGGKSIWVNVDHRRYSDAFTLSWAAAHESAHNAGVAHDYAYKHQTEKYEHETPEQRLDNADNYTDFLISNPKGE